MECSCSLPLCLQDLCVLAIVNNLDSYRTELLASMPHWLRHRLLSCLPAVELYRLESTSVATKIKIDDLWKQRIQQDNPVLHCLRSLSNADDTKRRRISVDNNGYQLDVYKGLRKDELVMRDQPLSSLCLYDQRANLTAEIVRDLGLEVETNKESVSLQCKYLLNITSQLLSGRDNVQSDVVHELISISTKTILSNLVSRCENPRCGELQELWKRQAIPLMQQNVDRSSDTALIPTYLLQLLARSDPWQIQLLSTLVNECQLRPSSAYVGIDSLSRPFLEGSSECTRVFNHLLETVSLLSLQCRCGHSGHLDLMTGIIKGVIATGEECKLKNLYCTIPEKHQGIMEALSSLFSLKNFRQLTLAIVKVDPKALKHLLQVFMESPCQNTQKLMISISESEFLALPKSLEAAQLPSMPSVSVSPPPQHKFLAFSTHMEFMGSLYWLLQLPTVRLKQITLVHLTQYHEFFHLCAVHPDLQTTELEIEVNRTVGSQLNQLLPTFQTDLKTLFSKHSLQRIVFRGKWGQFSEIKSSLVQALQNRSQLRMPPRPLKKLSLELLASQSYKAHDFQLLCDAIFTLPQLNNLELVLGKGFVDLVKQKAFKGVLHRSWSQKGRSTKLKTIELQTRFRDRYTVSDIEHLSRIAQTCKFTEQPREVSPNIDYVSDREDYMGDSDDECCLVSSLSSRF